MCCKACYTRFSFPELSVLSVLTPDFKLEELSFLGYNKHREP